MRIIASSINGSALDLVCSQFANPAPLAHQPAGGPLQHPAAWQHGEALELIRALDHFELDFGQVLFDPIGRRSARIPAPAPACGPAGAACRP